MQLEPQATICPRDGTSLTTSLKLDPAFDKYEFQESVGAGGMGIIYKARHVILNKVMAIKTMHSHLSSPDAIRRFQIEGKATSALSHQNIIAVHDFGVTESGQAYMVMDFVNGKTLADVLRLAGQLPLPRFYHIFMQVCDALSHAHARSILHRDIKPSNIMLLFNDKGEEEVRIMDFGIAKILTDTGDSAKHLTKTGDAVGSPTYMSPEQAKGGKTDYRSDLYSLGCVMYEALTGSPPFEGKAAFDTMLMHLETKPTSLREASMGNPIDPRLEQLVMRLLEKNPDNRYQSMDEVNRDLAHLARSDVKGALPSGTGVQRAVRAQRKDRGVLVALVFASCSLLLIGGVIHFQHNKVSDQVKTDVKTEVKTEGKTEGSSTHSLPTEDAETIGVQDAHWVDNYFKQAVKADAEQFNVTQITNGALDVTDDNLLVFKDKTLSMKRCNLSRSEITDNGLASLNRLNLIQLDVGQTQVKTLAPLERMQELRELVVRGTNLDKSAFELISHLKKLRRLDLQNTQVDAQDLQKLNKLSLSRLDLRYAKPPLPLQSIVAFEVAHPLCEVLYEKHLDAAKSRTQQIPSDRTCKLMAVANELNGGNRLTEAIEAYETAAQACERDDFFDGQIACEFSRSDCLVKAGKNELALEAVVTAMKQVLRKVPLVDPAWKSRYFSRRADIEENLQDSVSVDDIIADRIAGERRYAENSPRQLLASDYQRCRSLNLTALADDLVRRGSAADLEASTTLRNLIAGKDKMPVEQWRVDVNRVLALYPES